MDEITLRNFRCFRDKQTTRLAPLTLLVGENSTGKTSFLAMIRALWDVAFRNRIPDFKEEPYDLGSFDEIAHHRGARGGRAEEIAAEFKSASLKKQKKGHGADHRAGHWRFAVTFRRKGTAPIPVTRRLADDSVSIEICQETSEPYALVSTPNGSWKLQLPDFFVSNMNTDENRTLDPFYLAANILFRTDPDREIVSTAAPQSGSRSPTPNDFELIEQLAERILNMSHFARRPYASAPVRSKPRRTYDPARPVRDPEGDYVPMFLASNYFQNKTVWAELRKRLEQFGQDAGLFDEIMIRPLGRKDSEPFQVQVRKYADRLKGPPRNLIDVGYGVSQVLPVITELLRADAPPMFLLQQPEVHLHPSAQAALGSLFCKVASRDHQLVVETHSDHLLDRVRMDIRDGIAPLKSDDVSILYFERGELDVRIHSIGLDRNGNVVGAPDSYRRFFMKETTRSLGL